jgi:MFS family permease
MHHSKTSTSSTSLFQAWIVLFAASLFFFYEFAQLNMFSTINADLMSAFNVSALKISNLSAFYFYANVICLFPVGIILDRVSTRKAIILALSVCAGASLLLSFTHDYWVAALLRLLSGVGSSFCLLSAMRLATRWFPASHLAFAMGVVVTFAMCGGLVSQTPVSLLVQAFGWRQTLFYDGLLGFLFVVIIFFVVKDFPPHSDKKRQTLEMIYKMGFWKSLSLALKNRQNWFCGVYTSLMNLPILIIGALWGTLFLIQGHHFSQDKASTINGFLFLGSLIGCSVLGLFSDKLGRRKPLMIVGGIASLILVLLIMYGQGSSFLWFGSLFFLLGFFTSAQVLSYPVIAESNPQVLTGSATGLAALVIMGGGAVGQPLFGYLLDKYWNGAKVDGTPFYTLANYDFAWRIMPLMFIVALVVTFLIRETYCKMHSDIPHAE